MSSKIKWPKNDDFHSKKCPHCQMLIVDYREEDTNIKLYRINIERALDWSYGPKTLSRLFAMDENLWSSIPGMGKKTVEYLKFIRGKMSRPVKIRKSEGKIITTYEIITDEEKTI